MAYTDYKAVTSSTADALTQQVESLISAGWQPIGGVAKDGAGNFAQALTKGTPITSSAATLNNGDSVSVVNSAGGASHTATAEVSAGSLSDVKLAATAAMVDNAGTVAVHNSAGSNVAGTHSAEVAAGVLTDVKLAATIAPVANGFALTGVAPTGTYATTVTFTVANGAVTAIALS